MKKISFFIILLIMLFGHHWMLGQNENWPVKAIVRSGKFIDIKAIQEDGTQLDIVATQVAGDALFMDVKALKKKDKKGWELFPAFPSN